MIQINSILSVQQVDLCSLKFSESAVRLSMIRYTTGLPTGSMNNDYTTTIVCRKLTISDSVEKSLKKGKSDEQSWASRCLVLLLLQLGVGVDSETLFRALKPVLSQLMADPSASPKARSAVSNLPQNLPSLLVQ